jgi:hypothetical protein
MDTNKVCGLYSLRDLDLICLQIKNEQSKLSEKYLSELYRKYSNSATYESNIKNRIKRLSVYHSIIRRLKQQVLCGSSICLDRVSLQGLVEKITRLVGKNCHISNNDYLIDDSKEEQWVIKRPFCRTYEDWEKWAKYFAGKLKLELKTETEQLNKLILEISRETITANVLLALSAYTEARENLNLEINRSDEEIKLDFELMLEKVSGFDLSLDVYVEMIKDHKLSFDIIKTVYDEGLSLDISGEKVQLKTPINAYTLEELSGEIDVSYLKKFGMDSTINKKDLLQDYS